MSIGWDDPAPQPQTADPDTGPGPGLSREQIRDLTSLALVLIGAAGLITVAFITDVRLGVAALSTVLIVAGIVTGIDRQS